MERTGEYLHRKNAELRWLNGRLARPVALDPATSVQSVVSRKLAIRARLLAEAVVTHPWLTETNAQVGETHTLGPVSADYRYQRFDLRVSAPPLVPPPDLPVVRSIRYTSSGMAAITAVLVALGRAPAAPAVVVRSDGYYETRQVLSELSGLTWDAVDDPARAVAGPGRHALLVDSITATDDAALFETLAPGSVDLLLVDTTCWSLRDPRIARAEEAAVRLRVPVVLLRSHVKLDFLGVEYGRLGSATFTLPLTAPEPVARRFRSMQEVCGHFVRLVGSAPVPYHLSPILADHVLHDLNAVRLARIGQNTTVTAARVAARVSAEVGTFHHGLFFTVAALPPGDDPPERVEAVLLTLLALCRDLPVRFANSFGFDFVGLAPFRHRGRGCVRVALGDVPDEVAEAVADRIVTWAGHLAAER